jgi:hypothetical protein
MTLPIAPYDRSVLYAVRALFDGTANEGQQTRAMEWIILNLCHVGQLSFNTDSDRLSAFRDGERHIGLQLARMREPEGLKQLEVWEASTERKREASKPARGENGRSKSSTGR